MAITRVERQAHSFGDLNAAFYDITGPASYAADGQSITAADLGLKYIHFASSGGSDDGAQFTATSHLGNAGFPVTTVKIAWFVVGTGAEVANGVDLSARTVRVLVIGR